jgi:hypothetical protein
MKYCSVYGCVNTINTAGKSFYRFPREKTLKSEWAVRVALTKGQSWTPGVDSKVCSDHFTDDCFMIIRRVWSTMGQTSHHHLRQINR